MTGPVLNILSASEPWAEYQLEDGTTLRFRFTACSFRKTGKVINGLPEYSFASHVHCETHVSREHGDVVDLRVVGEPEPESA